jgi:hypothetical protein
LRPRIKFFNGAGLTEDPDAIARVRMRVSRSDTLLRYHKYGEVPSEEIAGKLEILAWRLPQACERVTREISK